MAAAIFSHLVRQAGVESGFDIDSAGTSPFHEGKPYHPGTVRVCEENGVLVQGVSRPVSWQDLREFDWILTMDEGVHQDVLGLDPAGKYAGKVHRMRDFSSPGAIGDRTVPDPVQGGAADFEHVFHILLDAGLNLLKKIRQGEK